MCLRATLAALLAAPDAAQPLVDERECRRSIEPVESYELIAHDDVAALAGIADKPEPFGVRREPASVAGFQAPSLGLRTSAQWTSYPLASRFLASPRKLAHRVRLSAEFIEIPDERRIIQVAIHSDALPLFDCQRMARRLKLNGRAALGL